jgi:hypothetical protein
MQNKKQLKLQRGNYIILNELARGPGFEPVTPLLNNGGREFRLSIWSSASLTVFEGRFLASFHFQPETGQGEFNCS